MGFTLGVTPADYSDNGAAGWSTFTPAGGGVDGYNPATPATTTRILHASNTGSDNEGAPNFADGSSAKPYATISHSMTRMRNGSPDWLLLDVNGTWTNETFVGALFGMDEQNRMLISSYDPNGGSPNTPAPGTGGRQPLVRTQATDGGMNNVGGFFACVDIDFYSYQRNINDPGNYAPSGAVDPAGFSTGYACNDTLIEGCKFRYYASGIIYPTASIGASGVSNYIARRNAVIYGWSSVGQINEGFGLQGQIPGMVIEECVAIHNGWQEGGTQDSRSRNYYDSNAGDVSFNFGLSFRGNISAHDSSGTQQRQGGTIDNSLFLQSDYVILNTWGAGQVSYMTNNVVMEHITISAGDGLSPAGLGGAGQGFIGDIVVTGNIIAHETDASASSGISLAPGMGSVTCSNNIVYKWCVNDPSNAIISTTGAINTLGIQTAGSGYANAGNTPITDENGFWTTEDYKFTITSAAHTFADVYQDGAGNQFTVGNNPQGSPSTDLIVQGTQAPSAASGTLTKVSGSGPATYTYSAWTEYSQFRFELSPSSSNYVRDEDVYQDSVTGAQFTIITGACANVPNVPRIFTYKSTGSASSSGTLTRVSGSGPATLTFSKALRIHYQIPVTSNLSGTGAVITAYSDMSGAMDSVETWNYINGVGKSAPHNDAGYVVNEILTPSVAFGGGTGFTAKVTTITVNTLTNNKLDPTGSVYAGGGHPEWPDPNRTVATYAASIGISPATTDGFLAQAALNSKYNWNRAWTAAGVNDYIRAGFGIGAGGGDPMRSMGNRYGVYKTRPTKIPHAA